MEPKPPYRDLLLADLALVLGIAPARDVAFALQRFWDKRGESASILTELREIAHLSDEDADRLEAEVAKLIEEACGDARLALEPFEDYFLADVGPKHSNDFADHFIRGLDLLRFVLVNGERRRSRQQDERKKQSRCSQHN